MTCANTLFSRLASGWSLAYAVWTFSRRSHIVLPGMSAKACLDDSAHENTGVREVFGNIQNPAT